jgi:hypothetical protein
VQPGKIELGIGHETGLAQPVAPRREAITLLASPSA